MECLRRMLEVDNLKTTYYRLSKKIEIDLTVYRNSVIKFKPSASITGGGRLFVGKKWPAYYPYKTLLSVWDRGSLIVIGEFMVLSGCKIVVDTGATLKLGSGGMNSHSSILCFNHIEIGNDVHIADNVIIRDSDNHNIVDSTTESSKPIIVGDHVWIGMNSIILKGVNIGHNSIIAAGSVVCRDIPDNTLAGGVPAKVIREGVNWE
jgi:serine acetyltransferase